MKALLDEFRPGRTIYLPGATGEILGLTRALAVDPGRLRDVDVVSCLLPGVNRFDYAALHEAARLTTFLLPPECRASFDARRVHLMPIAYSAIARHFDRDAMIDTAVAHVAPPDESGRCSFGIASDFSPIAWRRARRRVALVNHAMPPMRRGPRIAMRDADAVVECDSPLVELARAAPDPVLIQIGRRAAEIIPDGAAIQVGIGNAPGALLEALTSHRGIRLRSGMVSDGFKLLWEAGALAGADDHLVGIAAGSRALYDFLSEVDPVAFADTATTHDHAAIAATKAFHAVNSALEVDLFGQVNLEWRNGQLVGGIGGAPDFARAALASAAGRSMILMAATAQNGAISRIVPRLIAPTVSMSRDCIDTVVTEHGLAELRTLTVEERAQALIGIAAEPFRDDLQRAWRDLRRGI